jgi:hypothetical protein
MKTRPRIHVLLIHLFLSFAAALFLEVYRQSAADTILAHSLRLGPLLFLFWAAAFGFIYLAWRRAARRPILPLLPLGFFLLSPLLLRFYTTRGDLRIRLRLLALFVLLSILFLIIMDLVRLRKKTPLFLVRAEGKFTSLSTRRRLLILFLVSFFVYQAAAFILVWEGTTFSGDEPYYLLSSHSLLRDGDINLANNYAQQDYFSFYSRKDNPRLKLGIYGRYGRKGTNYVYPINLPGISVLMLPFYWLSQLLSGKWLTLILKVSLSPWAALLGLQVYLYARELWEKERLALGLWALYSFSAPILFFAVHLFSEIPITLFSFYIFRKTTGRTPPSMFSLLLASFLLGLFPWFGLKYNFFFYPLFLVSLYFLIKEHKFRFRALAFASAPIVSMILFYLFIHSLYGTFSPIAVYEGVLTPDRSQAFLQTFLAIPLWARLDAFLDYFLDQRDGLLLYSPLYFFALLGLVELFRRRKRDFWCLLLIGLPFLLNYALFTHRQGASPQGRVLTPVSWIGIIALGHFLVHNRRKIFEFLFGAAAAAGFVIAGILLAHPSFLYQPTTHEFTSRPGDLFIHLSNLNFFLPSYLPSFIKVDNTRYWPNYIWISALIIFVGIYTFSKRARPLGQPIPILGVFAALIAAFFLWALFPRTVLFPVKTVHYSPQRALGFYTFSIGKGVIAKESGDFYLHLARRYQFIFGSRTKLEAVKLRFGSDKGEHELRLNLFDLPLFDGKTSYEHNELIFAPAACYSFRNLYLYEIDVDLIQRSSESMLLAPYLFEIIPWRE